MRNLKIINTRIEYGKVEDADLFTSVTVIINHKDIIYYSLNEYEEKPETLKELQEYITKKYGKMDYTIVITEYGLSGRIYKWGNHGEYWELVGNTQGFA